MLFNFVFRYPQRLKNTSKFFVPKAYIKQDQSPKIKRNTSKPSSRLNTMSQDRSNFGSSWSDPRTDEPTWDPQAVISSTRTCLTDENDRADKILEIDTRENPLGEEVSLKPPTHGY